jgi:hypothetical protein
MRCSDVEEKGILEAYARNQVSRTVRLEVRRHLARCPNCFLEMEGCLRFWALIKVADIADPSDSIRASFRTRRFKQLSNRIKRKYSAMLFAPAIQADPWVLRKLYTWFARIGYSRKTVQQLVILLEHPHR